MASYVHHVPGRLRVKVPALTGAPHRVRDAVGLVNDIEGVTSTTANPRSNSLIIHYTPKTPEAQARVVDEVFGRLREAGLFEAARAPALLGPSAVAASQGVATLIGAAAGRALFGAVLRSGIERSVAGLVAAAIR